MRDRDYAATAQVAEYGVNLTNTFIIDHPTVAAIAAFLAEQARALGLWVVCFGFLSSADV